VAGEQSRQGLVDEDGVRDSGAGIARIVQQGRVDGRTQTCPSRATSVPRAEARAPPNCSMGLKREQPTSAVRQGRRRVGLGPATRSPPTPCGCDTRVSTDRQSIARRRVL
jgi:hypothetical protein